MSLSGKDKDEDIFSLVECFLIGFVLFVGGIVAIFDHSHFKIMKIIDFGKYHFLIGVLLIVIGACYIFLSFKGYED
jgi:hypothetical protein